MAQLQEQWLNEELSLKTIYVLHMKEDDFQMKEKISTRDQRTLKTYMCYPHENFQMFQSPHITCITRSQNMTSTQ